MFALEMKEITKQFPGVKALKRVNLQVKKGEIHALCGENGAGKSTLMNVLSGVFPAGTYEGEIIINGQKQAFTQLKDAEKAGIAIIHQELALVPEMSIAENIFLGNEPNKRGKIEWDSLFREAGKWLASVGLQRDPREKVNQLGIGEQQLVEIAKALAKRSQILILDEPSAALTESEVDTLVAILERLRSEGVSCIYISHKLPEVFRLADRITVLRDGKTIGTFGRTEVNESEIVAHMVGRELTEQFPRVAHQAGETVMEVRHYSLWKKGISHKKWVDDISFEVRRGEILGIAGLMGSGRSELMMSLFGAYEGKAVGEVRLNGKPIKLKSVQDALQHGIALVSEDRKRYGLVLGMDVQNNIMLASLNQASRWGIINENEMVKWSQYWTNELRTKAASLKTKVQTLSGGNQQKIVLAKCLMAKPNVLILDEPTRGIDVGAKVEIYHLMNRLVDEGVAIIMVSSDLQEVLGMSDRILVMSEGKIAREFDYREATQEAIMQVATGGI